VIDQLGWLVGLLAVSSLGWWLAQRRDGRFRRIAADPAGTPVVRLGADVLGTAPDHPATFVLITSATCSTCPQVRRVLASVAAEDPAVEVRELAAEDHLDLVRRLGVLRTPTVLLLDATGALRSRTSGPMKPEQARAALTDLLPTDVRS